MSRHSRLRGLWSLFRVAVLASLPLVVSPHAGTVVEQCDVPPSETRATAATVAPGPSPERLGVFDRGPRHGRLFVVAHRGAHQGIPENSLPAYEKAIELGVDFVEIDVRTTKDGRLVSIHNDTVDAYVNNANGPVRDYTLNELRALDIGIRHGERWRGTRIPTLEEILDLCQGKCGIYLDLKDADVETLVEAIKRRGMERDVLWYADYAELARVHELHPGCVIMPDPGPASRLPDLLRRFTPRVVAAAWRHYSEEFVTRCHAADALVIVDESDPSCWEDAIAWGSDGIQTDHPKELIEWLSRQ